MVGSFLFCIEFWRDLFLENGGEHGAQTSKLIISNSNEALFLSYIILVKKDSKMSKLIRFSLDCLLNFGLENLIYVGCSIGHCCFK